MKPEIFTLWPFTKNVCQPLLEEASRGLLAWWVRATKRTRVCFKVLASPKAWKAHNVTPLHFGQTKQVPRLVTEVRNKFHLLMEEQQGHIAKECVSGRSHGGCLCGPSQSPFLSGDQSLPRDSSPDIPSISAARTGLHGGLGKQRQGFIMTG